MSINKDLKLEQDSALHICIDIRSLETGSKYRGYGYYVRNLASNVIKIDKTNNYSFIVYGKENPLYEDLEKNGFKIFEMAKPRIKPRMWWLWDQLKLPALIKKINPSVFVSLDANLPLAITFFKTIKTVVAVHDLIPLVLKDEYRLPLDRKIDFNLKILAAKRADAVLTISKFSKQDIVEHLKIPANKVKYIYESTDKIFSRSPVEETRALVKKYANGQKYLMTVGHYYGSDPRKNYLFLLEGFTNLISRQGRDDLILLLVGQSGGSGNEYSRITAKAKELGVSEKVVFTDFVSDKDLAGLYSGSEVFVYPTKYEGFGLPILQAMSCGCPVVAANNTSIPEVAGSAAELFETNDQQSFLVAILKVLNHQKDYQLLGYENIKRFSWENAAAEFVEFMDSF